MYLAHGLMFSYWQHSSFRQRPDLVVIGAGIVGCFAALFYKQQRPSHRVMVLERGLQPDGATVKNAGFACFGSPTELLDDIEKEGEANALARIEERWTGLALLRNTLGDKNIGFTPSGGYEVFRTRDEFDRTVERMDDLNRLLVPVLGERTFRVDDEPVGSGLSACGLIRNDLEGQVHSGMLSKALLRKCQEAGVEFLFGQQVMRVEEQKDQALIQVGNGRDIAAAKALVATNGYTSDLMEVDDLLPARAQVLITEPMTGLKLRGCYHLDRGFYYFRDVGDRVLLGGGRELDIEGETTDHEGTTILIQAALEKILYEVILPGYAEVQIAHRWSGIMGVGNTKTPIVKPINDHVHVALRLGGMGVAIGSKVGQRAAEMLL